MSLNDPNVPTSERDEYWPKMFFYPERNGENTDIVLAGPCDVVATFYSDTPDTQELIEITLSALNESLIAAGMATREAIDNITRDFGNDPA